MKKFIVIMLLAFAFMGGAYAQQGQGIVGTITADTIQSNETIYLGPVLFTGKNLLTIEALCTQVGGTSDGQLMLQGSLDGTSYVTLAETAGLIHCYPNDTLTITNGAVGSWTVINTPWKYYRIKAVGTASDTTLITPKYIYK